MQVDDQLPGLSVNGTLVENGLITENVNEVKILVKKRFWQYLYKMIGVMF